MSTKSGEAQEFNSYRNNIITKLSDYLAPQHEINALDTTLATQLDATLAAHRIDLEVLAEGLITLGYKKKEVKEKIQAAANKYCVAPHIPSEEKILGEALRG